MDHHYIEGATRHAVAGAHQKDLALQDKYNVKFWTYWFDEMRSTTFCLIDAPNRETIERAHDEAHALTHPGYRLLSAKYLLEDFGLLRNRCRGGLAIAVPVLGFGVRNRIGG